jgi:DNA-binding MarR family transcriptional regulator
LAILVALRKIGAGIDGYRRAVAAHFDLVTADLVAIGLLHQQEPQRASQIGEHTGLPPGSVTALLDRLEARGYLTRVRPAQDHRSRPVRLTPRRRALGDALVDVLLPVLTRIVEDIGPEDYRTVTGALDQASAALAALASDPQLPERFAARPADPRGAATRPHGLRRPDQVPLPPEHPRTARDKVARVPTRTMPLRRRRRRPRRRRRRPCEVPQR